MSGASEEFEPLAEHTPGSDREDRVSRSEAAPESGGVVGNVEPAAALSNLADGFKAALPTDALTSSIQALKAKQKELRETKVKLAKDLRNQERRRKRLRTRARQLTDEDLLQVMMLRKSQQEEQETKRSRSASSSGGAAGSSSASATGSTASG